MPSKYTARYGQPLSPQEREISKRVIKTNKIIAGELLLTEGTVKEYLHRIFVKTGVTSRTGLAIYWLELQQREAQATTQHTETA